MKSVDVTKAARAARATKAAALDSTKCPGCTKSNRKQTNPVLDLDPHAVICHLIEDLFKSREPITIRNDEVEIIIRKRRPPGILYAKPQIFSADSEEVGTLIEGLRAVEDLIHDSCGVTGLRKDGEDEQWNDLRPDWLKGFDRAVEVADGIVQRMIRKEALDGGLEKFKEWADAASRETLTAVWDALPVGRILSGERLK